MRILTEIFHGYGRGSLPYPLLLALIYPSLFPSPAHDTTEKCLSNTIEVFPIGLSGYLFVFDDMLFLVN